jgi:cyclopropane fatty-acyl-phospholipid synthase-like methyltransferase
MGITAAVHDYWDTLYRREDYVYGTAPSIFLREQSFRFSPGMRALIIGDGEGRNGVWLAEQGLEVVSADLSPFGVAKAGRLATERGVELTLACGDVLQQDWPAASFDLISASYVHLAASERRTLHRSVVSWLRAGGLFLLEGFGLPPRANDLGARAETLFAVRPLREELAALEIEELLQGTVVLNEGPLHQGIAEVVRMVARKPVPAFMKPIKREVCSR